MEILIILAILLVFLMISSIVFCLIAGKFEADSMYFAGFAALILALMCLIGILVTAENLTKPPKNDGWNIEIKKK